MRRRGLIRCRRLAFATVSAQCRAPPRPPARRPGPSLARRPPVADASGARRRRCLPQCHGEYRTGRPDGDDAHSQPRDGRHQRLAHRVSRGARGGADLRRDHRQPSSREREQAAPITMGRRRRLPRQHRHMVRVQALLDAASPLGPRLEAITGFIAIVVLAAVILNWFVHKMYWSEWIDGSTASAAASPPARAGSPHTASSRSAHERLLPRGLRSRPLLQNLELQQGSAAVAEGVGIGLLATSDRRRRRLQAPAEAALQEDAHRNRGSSWSFVLVVMVGGTARTFIDLGWLPNAPTPSRAPDGWRVV